jgi:hypothetical protein
VRSVESIRQYNTVLELHLFTYGSPSAKVIACASRHCVDIHDMGRYERLFGEYTDLATTPTLHKIHSIQNMPGHEPTLFLDCDTFAFGDITALAGDGLAVRAREEVLSRGSHFGYDPNYLDEETVDRLFTAEQATRIQSFNTGVMLIPDRIRRSVDFGYILHTVRRLNGRELPYPSSNAWIVEEIATWLAIGRVPNAQFRIFARDEVDQGSETTTHNNGRIPLLSHYWTNQEAAFVQRFGLT